MRSHTGFEKCRAAGFSLVEVAVVLAIVGLLLGGLLYTLAALVEQRNREETARRLEDARELLVAFALVNGRLPCPATAAAGTGDEDPPGGGTCATNYSGFLPALAIGAKPVDNAGYALDAWGNRIRYAVSDETWGNGNKARFTKKHVANDPTAAWHLDQTPKDLVVCSVAPPGLSCTAGTEVTNQKTVVALVYSTGHDGAMGAAGTNEQENLDGDPVFIDRSPDPPGAPGGEYDDMMVWLPVGVLYSRMVAAGLLP